MKLATAHFTSGESLLFQACLINEFGYSDALRISDNGERFEIHYPTVLDTRDNYISPYVLLEFGARNITDPCQIHQIKPELSNLVHSLNFPVAQVNVLLPERTFWEKVTLIHVECNRQELKKDAERLSRHWYDLIMLYQSPIGKAAMAK